jgi:CheY-like chemotaxis protein
LIDNRILLAEDDSVAAFLFRDSLASLGYQVTIAENGRQAMEFYSQTPFPIVVTDYDMPEMNGSQLIDFLKGEEDEPIIFVFTSHSETSLIIDIMKKGIYDYLVKPVDMDELSLKLKRAYSIYDMRKLDRITKKERQLRLEGHLDWIKWKERMGGDFKNVSQNLFESLQSCFSQGSGFGALVSLLKMVSGSAKLEGDFYKIDASIMDLINTNANMAEQALSTFTEIERIMNGKLELTSMSCNEIYDDIIDLRETLKPIQEIKKQTIYVSDKKPTFHNFNLKIHREYLKRAITEIITNACKFSVSESNVNIIVNIESNEFTISIYNLPLQNNDGKTGIPLPYENIVFEPFYRLTKFVYDDYKTLDFGLGLTKVESIIKRFNAKVEIKNVTDHSNFKSNPETRVICKIAIPIS